MISARVTANAERKGRHSWRGRWAILVAAFGSEVVRPERFGCGCNGCNGLFRSWLVECLCPTVDGGTALEVRLESPTAGTQDVFWGPGLSCGFDN